MVSCNDECHVFLRLLCVVVIEFHKRQEKQKGKSACNSHDVTKCDHGKLAARRQSDDHLMQERNENHGLEASELLLRFLGTRQFHSQMSLLEEPSHLGRGEHDKGCL